MLVKDIIRAVEQTAPPAIQEDWDNSGLQIGDPTAECTGVMICVDPTLAVLDEALAAGCNMIVSHHPLIFRGLKRLTGSTPVEAFVLRAAAAGVAVYSAHTSLDSAAAGVSARMTSMLGLEHVEVLDPRRHDLLKLTVYVPTAAADSLRLALFDAGAGHIGAYDSCSFSSEGTGTFRALEGSNPAVGRLYEWHHEPETRVEVVLPRWRRGAVEEALRQTHPYEEPAYEFVEVVTGSNPTGLGAVGVLPRPMTLGEIARMCRSAFGCGALRITRVAAADFDGDDAPRYRRVAVCGGAGGSLIAAASAARAQVYVTADIRYHDFADSAAGSGPLIIDTGHFESEQCARELLRDAITEKIPNFAVLLSQSETNPVQYI